MTIRKLPLYLCCALAVVVGSSSLMAVQKKHDRAGIDVTEVKRKKKNVKKAELQKTRITKSQAFLVATETRLKSEIQKAISYLKKTAQRMPKKSKARLEMRERLVNLRLELAVYEANAEHRKYDRGWSAWDRGGRRGREPKLSTAKSTKQWKILTSDASSLLREYPRSKNADVTMFNMGLAQSFLNKEKASARTFSQLIAKYPNSQKAGDAYFSLGDFYFDRADFRNGMNNYKSALRYKRSKTYAWAQFKLGWCHYNLGKYNSALRYWKATVSTSRSGGKSGAQLKDEALRDMVYAFAELKQVETAISYYRRNGGGRFIGKFLILLSSTFSDQGQYNQAIKVLKRYQQVEPYAETAPETQKEIISLNYELGRMATVWQELSRFAGLYGPRSRWAGRNKSKRKIYLEAQKLIKDQIIYYAKVTHKKALKDDNRRLYSEAMKGYSLFLKNYPRSKEAAEVKYNMADIEYFSKKYRDAGKRYLEIALLGKSKAVMYNAKTGKPINIHRKSASYMLDSYWQDFEPELKVMMKRKSNFSKPARPLTQRAKNFVKACGHYQKWYPNDKKNIKNCDVFITEVYARSNNKKMALQYFWLLVKKYPGTKEANEAVDNIIPMYKKDKGGLVKAAETLLKSPHYSKGKTGRMLREILSRTQIERVGKMADKGKRAKEYERLYKKNPRGPDADKLIYNAAVDNMSVGNIGAAIAAYMIVIKKHPKSQGAQEALLQVAKVNEKRMEFAAASAYYLQYSQKYPKDKLALGALAKSCELQIAIESSKSSSTCMAMAKRDPGGAKIMYERKMRAAFSSGKASTLSQLVRAYVSKFKVSLNEKIVAYAMIYNVNNGRGSSASQAASQIMSSFKRSPGSVSGESLRAVGGLVFKRANAGTIARFKQYKLKGGSVDSLTKTLQTKVKALQKVQAAYDPVLRTKDAFWGVAALYQLGYARELLAYDLENPPQIKGAKLSDVVKQLAPDAKAARIEARKFYETALKSVSRFQVYNTWAAKSRSGLARITGKSISFDDIIITPDFLGAEVPSSVASAVSSRRGM